LVAVSGTNCSIVVGAVLLVLRRARVRPALSALAGGVVLVAFVLVARPTPSVLRAALMAAIVLVSLAGGRPRQAVPALAVAALGLLVWNPQLAIDPGFTMSVVASAALLLIAPGWAEALRRRRVPAGVAEALAVAAAAHLVTAPVIAAMTGRVSLVAVPANVLAEPVVPAATLLGFATAVLAPLSLPAGRLFAELAGWPCRWLVGVADVAGGLPGARVVWPGGTAGGIGLVLASAGVVLLARRAGVLRVLVAGGLIGALVQIPVRSVATGWPPPGWVMVACDVGQGDALVLAAGPHAAVEVDAGPDPVAVDRCLRGLGVSDVALLVFSHYHLDHVGGVAGVFHDRRVERVLTGPLAEPASGVALVGSALSAHHLAISTPAVGAVLDVGSVHLEVLAPPAAFTATRSDPNNSSLVLRATIGDVRILLPGDVELEAQQAMLADRIDISADVLKVPHHGSAYSDPAFLAAVHARVAVISVGAHNDYGHPSPLLLAHLHQLDLPVRRTDHDGDIAVVGPRARLRTVVRGTAASTAALARAPLAPSAPDARMSPWQPRQLAGRSTSCPTPCRASCCWSATRSCSSHARSARSPPPPAAPIPT
jgi:competence protein ComEC